MIHVIISPSDSRNLRPPSSVTKSQNLNSLGLGQAASQVTREVIREVIREAIRVETM